MPNDQLAKSEVEVEAEESDSTQDRPEWRLTIVD